MTSTDALSVYAGAEAQRRLRQHGWAPELFDTMIGASGGPKFLGIAGLDRALFGEFLTQPDHTMHLMGSSIGCFRHAALAARDPVQALANLHARYIAQRVDSADKRSRTDIVGELCRWVLDGYLTDQDIQHICEHPRFISHVVTARGRGPNSAANALGQASGMFAAGVSNAVNRKLLQGWFQRVVFSRDGFEDLDFEFDDFETLHIPLTPSNTREAILASGSIPFMMPGERDIDGAPRGHYWDGGIVDYHFDFSKHRGNGLVLYPHFRGSVTPGWFDKFLPWRKTPSELLDRVVLLCPSDQYLATLPQGKIPDRSDFGRMEQEQRIAYWQTCADASDALGEAFTSRVRGGDPLQDVQSFP
ncbi:MAG: patatin-like phospholipase family protein [Pseudomonadota bacterium]